MTQLFDLFPFVLLGIAAAGLFWVLRQKKEAGVALIISLVGILLSSTALAFILGLEQANFVSYRDSPEAYRIESKLIEEASTHFSRLKLLIQFSYASSLTALVSLLFLQLSGKHLRWISWLTLGASVICLGWGIWFSSAPNQADRALFREGTASRYIEPKDQQ